MCLVKERIQILTQRIPNISCNPLSAKATNKFCWVLSSPLLAQCIAHHGEGNTTKSIMNPRRFGSPYCLQRMFHQNTLHLQVCRWSKHLLDAVLPTAAISARVSCDQVSRCRERTREMWEPRLRCTPATPYRRQHWTTPNFQFAVSLWTKFEI